MRVALDEVGMDLAAMPRLKEAVDRLDRFYTPFCEQEEEFKRKGLPFIDRFDYSPRPQHPLMSDEELIELIGRDDHRLTVPWISPDPFLVHNNLVVAKSVEFNPAIVDLFATDKDAYGLTD